MSKRARDTRSINCHEYRNNTIVIFFLAMHAEHLIVTLKKKSFESNEHFFCHPQVPHLLETIGFRLF